MIPHHSQHPPMNGRKVLKADLRREISPWGALVWAYADECVGIATNIPDDHHLYVSNGMAQAGYGERMARGSINAALDAHEDAFAIDGFLFRACGGAEGLKPYHRIREAAQSRKPIPAGLDLPPLRCLPRLDAKGRIDLLMPLNVSHRDRAYACLVTYEGYSDEEAGRIARSHALLFDLFTHAMACMVDLVLAKWRIVGT